MSSILTNNSAMVALQTLRSINSNLEMTTEQISTGKEVGSAKDNSAVWAISKVMESDVAGFDAISDSLSQGEAAVSVAATAAESVTDYLNEIKEKIISAQSDTSDRTLLQQDISALVDQITTTVDSAQFNGLNLVDGSSTETNDSGNLGVDVLASLNRDSSGNVTVSNIAVDAQNLSTSGGVVLDATVAAEAGDLTAGSTYSLAPTAFQGGGAALAADDALADPTVDTGFLAGDELTLTINSVEASYTVKEGDTTEGLVAGLKNALQAGGLDTSTFDIDVDSDTAILDITNTSNTDATVSFEATRGSGVLDGLDTLDVSDATNAATALEDIEGMIAGVIEAAAAFGSVQGRIENQSNFVSNLSDALTTGIGSMVDADMEEASARLTALQTQQQLGTQALSIANEAPSSIMTLFR